MISAAYHVLPDHFLHKTEPLFVSPVPLGVFVCLVVAAAWATVFVRPAAILLLEPALMPPALCVLQELTMKLLHPDRSISVCLVQRVRTASQAARLPAALESAPLGVTRYQEVEKAHRAPRVLQVHTVWKGASCLKVMACAKKALSRFLEVAKIDAVRFVIPTQYLRLTEPQSARSVTLLLICSRPVGHHAARISNVGKFVPIKLQLVLIAAATVSPAIAILSVL